MRTRLMYLVAFLVALLALPAANWAMGALAVARTDVTLLDQFPAERPQRGVQIAILSEALRRDTRETLLLGTSQVGIGLGTCDRPDVGRYWLNGIDASEMTALVELAFDTGPAGRDVVVDLSGTVGHRLLQDTELPLRAFGYNLPLGVRMLETTLAWRGLDHASLCYAIGNTTTAGFDAPGARSWIAFMDELWANHNFENDLQLFLQTIERPCAENGGALHLVWFPHFLGDGSLEILAPMYERGSRAVRASLDSRTGQECEIVFHDIAERWYLLARDEGRYSPRENWYDYNHFRQPLGQAFLNEILTGELAMP